MNSVEYITQIVSGLGPSTAKEVYFYIYRMPVDRMNLRFKEEEPVATIPSKTKGEQRVATALSQGVSQGLLECEKVKGQPKTYMVPIAVKTSPMNMTPLPRGVKPKKKPALTLQELQDSSSDSGKFYDAFFSKRAPATKLCYHWATGKCFNHEKGACGYHHPEMSDLTAFGEQVFKETMSQMRIQLLHALTVIGEKPKPSMDVVDTLLGLIKGYRDGDMTGKDFDKAVDVIRKAVKE